MWHVSLSLSPSLPLSRAHHHHPHHPHLYILYILCLPPRGAGLLPPVHEIAHSLSLESAYSAVTGSEPPYTNYTASFVGVLDYVWCVMG